MSLIINPDDNTTHSIYSKKGLKILKKYIKQFQSGGKVIQRQRRDISNALFGTINGELGKKKLLKSGQINIITKTNSREYDEHFPVKMKKLLNLLYKDSNKIKKDAIKVKKDNDNNIYIENPIKILNIDEHYNKLMEYYEKNGFLEYDKKTNTIIFKETYEVIISCLLEYLYKEPQLQKGGSSSEWPSTDSYGITPKIDLSKTILKGKDTVLVEKLKIFFNDTLYNNNLEFKKNFAYKLFSNIEWLNIGDDPIRAVIEQIFPGQDTHEKLNFMRRNHFDKQKMELNQHIDEAFKIYFNRIKNVTTKHEKKFIARDIFEYIAEIIDPKKTRDPLLVCVERTFPNSTLKTAMVNLKVMYIQPEVAEEGGATKQGSPKPVADEGGATKQGPPNFPKPVNKGAELPKPVADEGGATKTDTFKTVSSNESKSEEGDVTKSIVCDGEGSCVECLSTKERIERLNKQLIEAKKQAEEERDAATRQVDAARGQTDAARGQADAARRQADVRVNELQTQLDALENELRQTLDQVTAAQTQAETAEQTLANRLAEETTQQQQRQTRINQVKPLIVGDYLWQIVPITISNIRQYYEDLFEQLNELDWFDSDELTLESVEIVNAAVIAKIEESDVERSIEGGSIMCVLTGEPGATVCCNLAPNARHWLKDTRAALGYGVKAEQDIPDIPFLEIVDGDASRRKTGFEILTQFFGENLDLHENILNLSVPMPSFINCVVCDALSNTKTEITIDKLPIEYQQTSLELKHIVGNYARTVAQQEQRDTLGDEWRNILRREQDQFTQTLRSERGRIQEQLRQAQIGNAQAAATAARNALLAERTGLRERLQGIEGGLNEIITQGLQIKYYSLIQSIDQFERWLMCPFCYTLTRRHRCCDMWSHHWEGTAAVPGPQDLGCLNSKCRFYAYCDFTNSVNCVLTGPRGDRMPRSLEWNENDGGGHVQLAQQEYTTRVRLHGDTAAGRRGWQRCGNTRGHINHPRATDGRQWVAGANEPDPLNEIQHGCNRSDACPLNCPDRQNLLRTDLNQDGGAERMWIRPQATIEYADYYVLGYRQNRLDLHQTTIEKINQIVTLLTDQVLQENEHETIDTFIARCRESGIRHPTLVLVTRLLNSKAIITQYNTQISESETQLQEREEILRNLQAGGEVIQGIVPPGASEQDIPSESLNILLNEFRIHGSIGFSLSILIYFALGCDFSPSLITGLLCCATYAILGGRARIRCIRSRVTQSTRTMLGYIQQRYIQGVPNLTSVFRRRNDNQIANDGVLAREVQYQQDSRIAAELALRQFEENNPNWQNDQDLVLQRTMLFSRI